MDRSDRTTVSRRRFLGAGMAGATLFGCGTNSNLGKATSQETPHSGELPLTIAGYEYDRVQALIDGRVSIEGCQVEFESEKIGDMNTHVFSGPGTRLASEIGLSPFMHAFANDGFRDYSLVPVFPMRLFRHKSIFIRTDRGIAKPEDLKGKKVATPGYSSTSLTWIRGIMQHEYGVAPDEIHWVVSTKDSSAAEGGSVSKQENVLPAGLQVSAGPPDMDESDLLVEGEVDALFHAIEPRAFVEGHPIVARLLPDSRTTEQQYFAKTGIFPIMHAVAIRNDICESHPWLPKAVFEAYSKAKQLNYEAMKRQWMFSSLPWYSQDLEDCRKLMGDNFWPYGVEANRKTLEALFRYSYEQGLASRELTVEELFHPSTITLSEPS